MVNTGLVLENLLHPFRVSIVSLLVLGGKPPSYCPARRWRLAVASVDTLLIVDLPATLLDFQRVPDLNPMG